MSENENKAVNELQEEIMDELRSEPAAVQVKVAFAVLATVLGIAAKRDPDELKRAAVELHQLMNAMR
ncbi:hypothetical protein [Bradyrhizobium sp. AZCC 2289]|uniref:hypothetical protein n=1 Tax=Bradyrhizobium sp. AZCC 2289 TaxID=3117026 RepID=UPI002FF248BB